jgi:hypothetical protein
MIVKKEGGGGGEAYFRQYVILGALHVFIGGVSRVGDS